MSFRKKIQLGATPFLKSQPLIEGIERLFNDIDFQALTPKEIVMKMRSQELDIALLPSSELFFKPNYSIFPDISITCEGEHSGCVLFSKVLPDQIRKICVDKGAFVEYHLTKLMVPRLLMIHPEYEESDEFFSSDYDFDQNYCDAFLIYGEDCYRMKYNFPLAWDLGAAWVKLKQMPFVMYVWAVRWGVELGDLEQKLISLKDNSLRNINSIAYREGKMKGIDLEFCKNYYDKQLRFNLTSVMISSLRQFNRMMFEEDICQKQYPIRFYNKTQTDYSGVL